MSLFPYRLFFSFFLVRFTSAMFIKRRGVKFRFGQQQQFSEDKNQAKRKMFGFGGEICRWSILIRVRSLLHWARRRTRTRRLASTEMEGFARSSNRQTERTDLSDARQTNNQFLKYFRWQCLLKETEKTLWLTANDNGCCQVIDAVVHITCRNEQHSSRTERKIQPLEYLPRAKQSSPCWIFSKKYRRIASGSLVSVWGGIIRETDFLVIRSAQKNLHPAFCWRPCLSFAPSALKPDQRLEGFLPSTADGLVERTRS